MDILFQTLYQILYKKFLHYEQEFMLKVLLRAKRGAGVWAYGRMGVWKSGRMEEGDWM